MVNAVPFHYGPNPEQLARAKADAMQRKLYYQNLDYQIGNDTAHNNYCNDSFCKVIHPSYEQTGWCSTPAPTSGNDFCWMPGDSDQCSLPPEPEDPHGWDRGCWTPRPQPNSINFVMDLLQQLFQNLFGNNLFLLGLGMGNLRNMNPSPGQFGPY